MKAIITKDEITILINEPTLRTVDLLISLLKDYHFVLEGKELQKHIDN